MSKKEEKIVSENDLKQSSTCSTVESSLSMDDDKSTDFKDEGTETDPIVIKDEYDMVEGIGKGEG